jgi:hypothetical protein
MPTAIVLATLNARDAHVSLALGYRRANPGPLREVSMPCEFVLGATLEEVVEQVLVEQPRIVGLSVHIWNVAPLRRVVALLEEGAPDVVAVLGGPEVSHGGGVPADLRAGWLCGDGLGRGGVCQHSCPLFHAAWATTGSGVCACSFGGLSQT